MSLSEVIFPEVTAQIVSGRLEVDNAPQKLLVYGQAVGGTATTSPLTLYQNVRSDTLDALFGKRTELAHMLRAMKRIAPELQIDVVPFADGTTAAVKTITHSGAGTYGVGTIEYVIGSKKEHRYRVDVTEISTLTTVAAALEVLIDADDACPFTAGVAAGVVTLTSAVKGGSPQFYPVRVEGEVSGLTIVVASTVTGATDPSFTGATDESLIGTTRYQNLIWPFDDYTLPQALMESRHNVTNAVLDGTLWVSETLSHADHLTQLDTLNAKTLQYLASLLIETSKLHGNGVPELPGTINAMTAALIALRLTPDTALSQYLTTPAALDQFGGPALCSLPIANSTLPDLGIPLVGHGYTQVEINQLKDAGGWIVGQNTTHDAALIGEAVTTYLTNAAGNSDPIFKFLNYMITSSVAREFIANNLRARFQQSRAMQGDTEPGRDDSNPDMVAAFLEGLYGTLAGPDYKAVEAGEDARQYFKSHLRVTLDSVTGTYTITMRLPIITQARRFNVTITIELGTSGVGT